MCYAYCSALTPFCLRPVFARTLFSLHGGARRRSAATARPLDRTIDLRKKGSVIGKGSPFLLENGSLFLLHYFSPQVNGPIQWMRALTRSYALKRSAATRPASTETGGAQRGRETQGGFMPCG